MLTRVSDSLVNGLAYIDAIAEELVQRPLVQPIASTASDAFSGNCPGEGSDRAELEEALEDHPDCCGFRLVDDQFPVPNLVSERHTAAQPHSPLAAGRGPGL